MAETLAIGIDLGTTSSCVAVFRHGKLEIIPNDQGKRATPSYVAFTDTGRLIGDAAKNQMAMNPTNTIFDAKRLIGRNFEDPSVQSDMKHWPFQVVSFHDGMPKLEAKYKGEKTAFFPEEISAMVLTKMKETAEAYIGKKVTDAVITVPAAFNYSQRQATRDAATIAGLNSVRIITAPRAVALAYSLDMNVKDEEEWNVLIFDLGGGNCNVSIIEMQEGGFSVRSTAGDTHLGGEDFDNRMVNHFVHEFERKFGKDLSKDVRALGRLRTACERAKRTLSSFTQASIEIESLLDGIHFSTSISRARFEDMNADLFRAALDPVKKSLSDAKMDKPQIQDIVLVGGSSRIPKIQKLLRDFFNGKELSTAMDPDEAVAYGAAVQAAILYGYENEVLQNIFVNDVTPLSLGIETAGGAMTVLIKRNTPMPTEPSRTFNQRGGGIFQVYEGEHSLTKDNHFFAKINLSRILPALCGASQAEVTFHIDGLGVLNMRIIEKSTGEKSTMTINGNGRLPNEELERILNEWQKYRIDDEKQKELVSAKNRLESYCFSMKSTAEDILDKSKDIIHWLDANPLAKKEEFENKQKELEQACNPIMREMDGGGAPPNILRRCSVAGCSGTTAAKRTRWSHD